MTDSANVLGLIGVLTGRLETLIATLESKGIVNKTEMRRNAPRSQIKRDRVIDPYHTAFFAIRKNTEEEL
jgi:hypothetical protein